MDIKAKIYLEVREERTNGIYGGEAEASFLSLFTNLADARNWELAFINNSNFSNYHEWWYKELTPVF